MKFLGIRTNRFFIIFNTFIIRLYFVKNKFIKYILNISMYFKKGSFFEKLISKQFLYWHVLQKNFRKCIFEWFGARFFRWDLHSSWDVLHTTRFVTILPDCSEISSWLMVGLSVKLPQAGCFLVHCSECEG